MIIIYIDIVLLLILLFLTIFACGYCVYRVHRMQPGGQVAILFRPTTIFFPHKKNPETQNDLRSVGCDRQTDGVCVVEEMESDSGVSDAYEPLRPNDSSRTNNSVNALTNYQLNDIPKAEITVKYHPNSMNKTWNWNYKEYQI